MNLNLFKCPFYNLFLNQINKLEKKLYQNNLTFDEIMEIKNNYNGNIDKKSIKQKELNNIILSQNNKEIISFKHCEKCLLEKNNEKDI